MKGINSYRVTCLRQFCWDIIVNGIIASYFFPNFIRLFFYKLLKFKISATVHAKCYFGSNKIKIGKRTYINRGCLFDNENGAFIEIGNDCAIGYNVSFLTTNHDITNHNRRGGKVISKKICIKDGCWIGANSIILPGVTVEEGCVIGAGSIVTKNTESNCIYLGIPSRKYKNITFS
ncbi:MAG: acyltransferase [Candidatus Azobacteroides sp.]|nr:acyltransferase [Candidatus Azobacteroides sp.]